jgi:hypothetical protein
MEVENTQKGETVEWFKTRQVDVWSCRLKFAAVNRRAKSRSPRRGDDEMHLQLDFGFLIQRQAAQLRSFVTRLSQWVGLVLRRPRRRSLPPVCRVYQSPEVVPAAVANRQCPAVSQPSTPNNLAAYLKPEKTDKVKVCHHEMRFSTPILLLLLRWVCGSDMLIY